MKTLLVTILFVLSGSTVCLSQLKTYTVYGDTVLDIANIDSAEIEIVAPRDTVFLSGDSAVVSRLDNIIDQIPRMEVADSNTWVNLATLVNLVTQVKALVLGDGSPAQRAVFATDTAYLTFLNQTPRPRIVSAQKISTQWIVFHRP